MSAATYATVDTYDVLASVANTLHNEVTRVLSAKPTYETYEAFRLRMNSVDRLNKLIDDMQAVASTELQLRNE